MREAGARVQMDVLLTDTSLPATPAGDRRRIKVVATGTRWAHGVPLACDATMVSPLHTDGEPWPRAEHEDGVALERAEARKRATYPELVDSERCRLVVLACETGGRWSPVCLDLVRDLAASKARGAPETLQASLRVAWAARWWALLSVAAQEALAASLVEPALQLLDGWDAAEPSLDDLLLDAGV